MTDTTIPADLRIAARERLERQAGAKRFLALWAVLAALFVAIWALSSPGAYFWPVWPVVGIGIGVVFSFVEAYGRGTRITEDRIDAEVVRLRA